MVQPYLELCVQAFLFLFFVRSKYSEIKNA